MVIAFFTRPLAKVFCSFTASTKSSFNEIAPAITYAVKGYQKIAAVMRAGLGMITLMQCFMRSL
ncbi:MAG: hypothetical protein KME50_34215 [Nostoc desertorum CM1-VF14]|jgi:hypothetical protein|nr:hypothetical protein [Nostoc desertorum CM1-VF14]